MTDKKETKTKAKIVWPTAKIWLTTYWVDSDNKALLDMLVKARRDKEKSKMVDVPFLPIETIYQLLEQMFPNYEIDTPPMTLDKSFKVNKKKKDRKTKKQVEFVEEVFLFTKCVTLYLWPKSDPTTRVLQWEAKWVATIGQITSDQMYNWFNMKQESRAMKNALKKLWKLFRINWDLEDTMEKSGIKDELTHETSTSSFDDLLGTVAKWVEPMSNVAKPVVSDFEDKILTTMKTKLEGKWQIENKEYLTIAKEVKDELNIQDWTDDKDIMIRVVKELKQFYVK